MGNKLTPAQELALEMHERRRNKVYNISVKDGDLISNKKPTSVEKSKIPPVFRGIDENEHPFKETENSDKVRQFLMDTASEALDELTEQEQEERYQEDMNRLEEEFLKHDERLEADKETADDTAEDGTFDDEDFGQDFQQALSERRKRQGANPLTGGSHHCRYIKPEGDEEMPTVQIDPKPLSLLKDGMRTDFKNELRSVVREEVERAFDEFADIYRFETFLEYDQNQAEKQLKKDIEQIDYHNRLDRLDRILDRLEKASK